MPQKAPIWHGKKPTRQEAFTLIETLAAIFVISLVTLTVGMGMRLMKVHAMHMADQAFQIRADQLAADFELKMTDYHLVGIQNSKPYDWLFFVNQAGEKYYLTGKTPSKTLYVSTPNGGYMAIFVGAEAFHITKLDDDHFQMVVQAPQNGLLRGKAYARKISLAAER